MGKTYKRTPQYEDEYSHSGRSPKAKKHSNNKKNGGMRTLNSYVEEEYDFDDDPFDDEIEIEDDITIQHTKNTR